MPPSNIWDHPDEADALEANIRRDFHKLMSNQSKVAAWGRRPCGGCNPPTTSTMRIDRIEPLPPQEGPGTAIPGGGDLLRVTGRSCWSSGCGPVWAAGQLLAQVEQSAKRSEMKARGARLTGSRMLSKKQVMEHLTPMGRPGSWRRIQPSGWRS